MSYEVEEKKTDPEGRVLLPKAWRDRHGRDVVLLQVGEEIRILPKKPKPLSMLPRVKVPLKSSLTEWHKVKAELLKGRS